MRPLEGLLVLDFSQFLAGPWAALRLADLGARVVKIERPVVGDACRQLGVFNQKLDGDSVLFHTINRGKESVVADLKDPTDLARVKKLVTTADVLVQNFRPGVMQRFGLDYPSVAELNPRLVYGSVSGYGNTGPWAGKPGQDLLAQSLSGALWLNGHSEDPPLPFGTSIADSFTGTHLAQGILACLYRRSVTGQGGLVEVSLMESMIDLQFETFTAFLNDPSMVPHRPKAYGCSPYTAAPYGVYPTADGYLAIAMSPVPRLAKLLALEDALAAFGHDPDSEFAQRDQIMLLLAAHLRTAPTQHWLDILEPADVWCCEVLDWPQLLDHDGFRTLNMLQEVTRPDGPTMVTTRYPIRIDGEVLRSPIGAPRLGQNMGDIG
jgi:CoA:oxalate CoA-transferase